MSSVEAQRYDPSNAPLCRCCETNLSIPGVFPDPDLGPLCSDCRQGRNIAIVALHQAGLHKCAALGPDSGKGVLS